MLQTGSLDELLGRLKQLTPEQFIQQKKELDKVAPFLNIWSPNPGPQTEAYYSEADILLFGGQPGGGKTGLGLGLALTQHTRSLVVRKQFTDLEGVVDNLAGIVKDPKGLVRGNRPKYKKPDGGIISFQGMAQTGEIDTGKQGNAFDLIFVDEAAQLPENDIRLLIGWNRTTKTGQRCRTVLASNPPINSTGVWLGEFFAPWLDPKHANPAKPGELRWFIFDIDGKSKEVPTQDVIEINGKKYVPHSRTYIPSQLEDNPFINAEEYRKNLQTIPEPFRSMLLSGNFLAARADQKNQVIPTKWVMDAQSRWEKKKGLPPLGVPMCAIGVDPAGGGNDQAVLSPRYDHHFAQLIKFKPSKDKHGSDIAAEVIRNRRHSAEVGIDMGGGYGSSTYLILKENLGNEFLSSYKGSEVAGKRTKDGKLGFTNKRSQSYWIMREALDPDQPGGSQIELPPDPRLLAGLTALTFEINTRGLIKIETKEDVVARLGYSPDEADAVVIAWVTGRRGLVPETQVNSFNYYNNRGHAPQMLDKYANRRMGANGL